MGWFDRKIYFYFQHSHALTLSRTHALTLLLLSRSSPRPRVPVSPRLLPPLLLEPLCLFSRTHALTHSLLPLLPCSSAPFVPASRCLPFLFPPCPSATLLPLAALGGLSKERLGKGDRFLGRFSPGKLGKFFAAISSLV